MPYTLFLWNLSYSMTITDIVDTRTGQPTTHIDPQRILDTKLPHVSKDAHKANTVHISGKDEGAGFAGGGSVTLTPGAPCKFLTVSGNDDDAPIIERLHSVLAKAGYTATLRDQVVNNTTITLQFEQDAVIDIEHLCNILRKRQHKWKGITWRYYQINARKLYLYVPHPILKRVALTVWSSGKIVVLGAKPQLEHAFIVDIGRDLVGPAVRSNTAQRTPSTSKQTVHSLWKNLTTLTTHRRRVGHKPSRCSQLRARSRSNHRPASRTRRPAPRAVGSAACPSSCTAGQCA